MTQHDESAATSSPRPHTSRANRGAWLIDLGLFVATAGLALWLEWETTDLIWSLWLASLTIGYGYLLVSIVRGILLADGPIDGGFTTNLDISSRGGIALFMLGFFTFHFGLFHLVHGVFLFGFFPLADSESPSVVGDTLARLLGYWPFVLASLVAWRKPFLEDTKTFKPFKPYANVMRMHLLLFVFFGAVALRIDNEILYLLVLFTYFFPWYRRRTKNTPSA